PVALRLMVKISTFNTLTGGKINVNEKPSQIVNEIPFTRYHAFDIPAGVSLLEWTNACTSVPTKELKQTVISPRTNTGILAVSTDEDLEALEAATICVRGKPVQRKRLFAFKDTLVYIYISGLDAAPIVSLTKDINDALSPYGKVLDIEFEVLDLCSVGKARALIDVSVSSIPGYVEIRGKQLGLSGKKVDQTCGYCRDTGHHKNSCPKKRTPEVPYLPNSANAAINSAANRPMHRSRNNVSNRTNASIRNNAGNRSRAEENSNALLFSRDASPPPKKSKRPRSHLDSVATAQTAKQAANPVIRKKGAKAPAVPTAAKPKSSIVLSPGFITSFTSNANTSAVPNGMSTMLSPTKAPMQPTTSGSALLGARPAEKEVSPFTFLIPNEASADQTSIAQATPASNSSEGRPRPADSQ
ncbi:hypothetical protein IWW37_006095, partial [Coemansia sp. RSA 2050]